MSLPECKTVDDPRGHPFVLQGFSLISRPQFSLDPKFCDKVHVSGSFDAVLILQCPPPCPKHRLTRRGASCAALEWPVRLSVRTSGFQPEKRGSTPLRAAISTIFSIRLRDTQEMGSGYSDRQTSLPYALCSMGRPLTRCLLPAQHAGRSWHPIRRKSKFRISLTSRMVAQGVIPQRDAGPKAMQQTRPFA